MDVLVMTWNAGGLKFCSNSVVEKAKKKRNKKLSCVPNFLSAQDMQSILDNRNPEVCIIATQGEHDSDSYFHSDFLPRIMDYHQYELLTTDRIRKVGEGASGLGTGRKSTEMVSTSIYIKKDVFDMFSIAQEQINKEKKNFYLIQDIDGRKCAALTSYFYHTVYGMFAFTNVHLPTGVKRLTVKNYANFRRRILDANRVFLNQVVEKAVEEFSFEIDHHLLAGDFGTVINHPEFTNRELVAAISAELSAVVFKKFIEYDELEQLIPKEYKEGITNEGPMFAPTWSLARNREEKCQAIDKSIDVSCFNEIDQHSNIGWPDRIVYREYHQNPHLLHCLAYRRIDLGNMKESNHAGVLGYFQVQNANMI